MIWRLAFACGALVACAHGGGPGDACHPSCASGQACRYDTCVPAPTACTANVACPGDQYCDTSAMECLPWGIGPGGMRDATCAATVAPGVSFPVVQCAWPGPPSGDAFPDHVQVLATPMVAALDDPAAPSIVFPAYNGTDKGLAACAAGDPKLFGVIRVIDGRTCAPRATIASPTVIGSAPVAIGDLGGADATPEIVAARSAGGLVAFTRAGGSWQVLWQTASTLGNGLCDWAGPAIHDLDDDGAPEVIFYGAVYNGQTGAVIDESIAGQVDGIGVGYIPVIADVDGDGVPELVTGTALYQWDRTNHKWATKRALPGALGQIAVGDFGTFPAVGQDDRAHTDGVAEIAVAYQGAVRIFNLAGREVFSAVFHGGTPGAQGGPLTIADFDGDGRAELGSSGSTGYHLFDPDCKNPPGPPQPDPASCGTAATDGVLWVSGATLNRGDDLASSSAFDFDGDGRAEVVHADHCFTRIFDGATGRAVASRPRSSCLWYDNPVVADVDGDFNAELIATSNASCAIACPAIDPLFDGVQCADDADCTGATRCGRELRGDALGRCRCSEDADCGDGYACRDPIAGPSAVGKVCRAAHPATALTGVQVLADAVDRWVGARSIWNQHAYSVTNVDPAGRVPRTSQWSRNWIQPGLDTFRANMVGDPAAPRAEADLTVRQVTVACEASPVITAEVCNRGSQPVAPGAPIAVYAATTPSRLRCQTAISELLMPGSCATVSCSWLGPSGDAIAVADDAGGGTGLVRECREDNNVFAFHVACP